MFIEDLHIIKPSQYGPYTTIQAAVQAALASNPPSAVVITPEYTGTDTYTNTSNVPVLDLRPAATNKGSFLPIGQAGVTTGVQAVAAASAPITAAAGGVFASHIQATGNSSLEGVAFKVKATGWVTFAAGTYTATVQPMLYVSKTVGFSASAASAIVSAAALTMTITSATLATTTIWENEVEIAGDSTTGNIAGKSGGWIKDVNNLALLVTPAILVQANTPVSVNFATVPPLEFAVGVTLGSGAPATSVITLNKLYIES